MSYNNELYPPPLPRTLWKEVQKSVSSGVGWRELFCMFNTSWGLIVTWLTILLKNSSVKIALPSVSFFPCAYAWALGPGVGSLPRAVLGLRCCEDDPRQQASSPSPARGSHRQDLSCHQMGISVWLSWPGSGEQAGHLGGLLILSMPRVTWIGRWPRNGAGSTGLIWQLSSLSHFYP